MMINYSFGYKAIIYNNYIYNNNILRRRGFKIRRRFRGNNRGSYKRQDEDYKGFKNENQY